MPPAPAPASLCPPNPGIERHGIHPPPYDRTGPIIDVASVPLPTTSSVIVMNASLHLPSILQEGRTLRHLGDGLFSVMPEDVGAQRYDTRGARYDALVGNPLYNRLMWGTTPSSCRAFAREAVASRATGWLLDAGGGTLRFTARAYLGTRRPIVVVDRSLGMLRRARARVRRLAGAVPPHIVFLQADLEDLPFLPEVMQTILCMGLLHLFDHPDRVARNLRTLVAPRGQIFLSSLVESGRLGDRYLRLLHRSGGVGLPHRKEALQMRLGCAMGYRVNYRTEGNMAYAVAQG